MAICIIPAKGTSKRIPGKNTKDFLGKPIIQYAVETALEARIFDDIYISTDSEEVEAAVAKYTVGIIDRPRELAEVDGYADCGTQEVTRHALAQLDVRNREIACCLYPCTPLLSPDILRMAFEALLTDKGSFAYVLTDVHSHHKGEYMCDAGQFYMGRAWWFYENYPVKQHQRDTYYIPRRDVVDINTPEDWARAEQMYKELHGG